MKLRNRIRAGLVAMGLTVASLVTVIPAQDASAATCYQSMWRLNSRGDCVKSIQALLNYQLPRSTPLAVDGIFGARTDRAVRTLQSGWYILRMSGIDGIVGPKTWQVLCQPGMGEDNFPGRVPRSYPIWASRQAGCPGADTFYYYP